MPTPLDTAFHLTSEYPPVEDLLLVYLGQSCGSRAPEPGEPHRIDAQDLWDHLGDFA